MTWKNAFNNIVILWMDGLFPELIKEDICIFTNTTFRVRNKKETIYCYSDEERKAAIEN
jgi:topoisomerase-4 subunit B